MPVDVRRLLIFRDVVRAGSISAAARELGWTQPAVSQHLARLEREAGSALLLRGPAGVTPTEAGQALVVRADAIAAELRHAGEELSALADLRSGSVRLVAFPSAAATLVPVAVQHLAERHPGVTVGFVESEPPEAAAAVLAGDADLAVVFGHSGPPPESDRLSWVPLLREPVHLVVPPGHRIARRRRPDLAVLAGEGWIGGCERCRQHLVARCRANGFEPDVRHETDDYVVVQNLVARGLGVTLLPDSALRAFRHPGVEVVASPSFGRRYVGLLHRRGAESVPATRALLERLVAAARAATA